MSAIASCCVATATRAALALSKCAAMRTTPARIVHPLRRRGIFAASRARFWQPRQGDERSLYFVEGTFRAKVSNCVTAAWMGAALATLPHRPGAMLSARTSLRASLRQSGNARAGSKKARLLRSCRVMSRVVVRSALCGGLTIGPWSARRSRLSRAAVCRERSALPPAEHLAAIDSRPRAFLIDRDRCAAARRPKTLLIPKSSGGSPAARRRRAGGAHENFWRRSGKSSARFREELRKHSRSSTK